MRKTFRRQILKTIQTNFEEKHCHFSDTYYKNHTHFQEKYWLFAYKFLKQFRHIFSRNIDISQTNFEKKNQTNFLNKMIFLRHIFKKTLYFLKFVWIWFFFKFVWNLVPENVEKNIWVYMNRNGLFHTRLSYTNYKHTVFSNKNPFFQKKFFLNASMSMTTFLSLCKGDIWFGYQDFGSFQHHILKMSGC